MDDLQAGRIDVAIKGFERVTLDEPRSYSAHFQLATLLQDSKKDYLGAINHYRAYLSLRPSSDKAPVADERLKQCESLYEREVLRKAGGSRAEKLEEINLKLEAEKKEIEEKLVSVEKELEEARKQTASLLVQTQKQARLLDKLSSVEESTGKPANISEALAKIREEDAARKASGQPSDEELIDGAVPVVKFAKTDDFASIKTDLAKEAADVGDVRAAYDANEKRRLQKFGNKVASSNSSSAAGKSTGKGMFGDSDNLFGKKKKKNAPSIPATYTVQEGDTLFKISEKFYGSSSYWRAIRESNKAIVSTDGRVKTGQVLKLPPMKK